MVLLILQFSSSFAANEPGNSCAKSDQPNVPFLVLEGVAVLDGFEVLHAVAEKLLLGEFLDKDDLRGHKDRGLAGLIRRGDFDERQRMILPAAFEAQAAFGHILAKDGLLSVGGMANAAGIVDFHARMLAAVDGGRGGFFRRRHRKYRSAQGLKLFGMVPLS